MLSKKDKKFIIILFLIITIIYIAISRFAFTGDEAVYVYQGLGIFHNLNFYPSEDIWRNFLDKEHYGFFTFGELDKFKQTFFPSLIYAPILSIWGLETARWTNFFIVGLPNFFTLFLILKRQYKKLNIIAFSLIIIFLFHIRYIYYKNEN